MRNQSPLRTLADHLLDEPVEDWINRRRAEGIAWRWIARDLMNATDGKVDVTVQTLQNWVEAGVEEVAAS